MSTSEAQVIARALYDSLVGGALRSLRAAAPQLQAMSGADADLEGRISGVLPSDAPREVRNFLLALAHEGSLGRLPEVIQAFEQYGQSGSQVLSGEVVSAVALDEVQCARITSDLRARYGDRLELRFRVDDSLIGGLIIRIGDQVLDNSLRARLSAIQRSMLAS